MRKGRPEANTRKKSGEDSMARQRTAGNAERGGRGWRAIAGRLQGKGGRTALGKAKLMVLMRQQSPDKAEDLLCMPTNDFDLVRRLDLSSMLMQRQEN